MDDLISRQAALEALKEAMNMDENTEEERSGLAIARHIVKFKLPSAQPDFPCEGCQTPKHICGICTRNYPNITDHYTGGEAG